MEKREIKLIWIEDVGRREMKDGRKYLIAKFKCPVCNFFTEKIKKEGVKAKYCSHACYAISRGLRGAYKNSEVVISGYLYTYMPTPSVLHQSWICGIP